jgi:aminoglycoside 6'-N-acetyltransferase
MITLREATPDDVSLLRHWDEQPHVIESDPNDDWNWEEELLRSPDWRKQFIAEFNGRPIGFVQIIDPAKEESKYWGEIESGFRAVDIWIGEADDLNKGYGTIIMRKALEYCFQNPDVKKVLIDPLVSNHNAHRFYERLGFLFLREQQFGNDLCRVYYFTREDFEKEENPSKRRN